LLYLSTEFGLFLYCFGEAIILIIVATSRTKNKEMRDDYLFFKNPVQTIQEFIGILALLNIPPLMIYYLVILGSEGYFGVIF
jgi:hypothetical protein